MQERSIGPVVVLDIAGRLVLDDGDRQLKEHVAGLLDKGTRHLVVNVAEVSYVDSAGLGALVGAFLSAKSLGGTVRLLAPSSRLQDLLKMARLLNVVSVCETEEQALGSFGVLT